MFVCGALLLGLYWLVAPYKVAEIKTPIQILNSNHQVAIGEPITMKIVLDKYSDIKPQVDTFITCDDYNTITQEGKGASRPVGHFEYINNEYTVPKEANVGATCRFNFKNTYRVNPIRTVTENWYSEEFKVVK